MSQADSVNNIASVELFSGRSADAAASITDPFNLACSMASAFCAVTDRNSLVKAISEAIILPLGVRYGLIIFGEYRTSTPQSHGIQFLTEPDAPLTVCDVSDEAAADLFPLCELSNSPLFFEVSTDLLHATIPELAIQRMVAGRTAIIPLVFGSESTGVMLLNSESNDRFEEWQQQYLVSAAQQCSKAIDTLRRQGSLSIGAQPHSVDIQSLLTSVVDHMAEYVLVVDRDLNVVACSRMFAELMYQDLGVVYRPGTNLRSALSAVPELATYVADVWQRTFEGDAFTETVQFDQERLSERTFEMRHCKLFDRDGNVVAGVAVGRDITAFSSTQVELRHLVHQLSEVQSVAKIGSWELDLDGKVVSWSNEMYELLDFDPAEGRPGAAQVLQRFHPDDTLLRNSAVSRLRDTCTPYNLDLRIIDRNNTVRWVAILGACDCSADGAGGILIEVLMDITVRKAAEIETRRLSEILETTSDLVATATPDGALTYANLAMRQFLGICDEDVCKYTVASLHTEESWRNLSHDLITPGLAEAGAWSGDAVFLSHTGKETPVSLKVFAHRDATGTIISRSGIARDITEYTRMQEHLSLITRRLEEAQQTAGICSWEMDVATGETWISNGFSALRGRGTSLPLSGIEELLQVYDANDRAALQDSISRSLSQGLEYKLDLHSTVASGCTKTFRVNGRAVKDSQNRVVRLIHTSLDITERVKMYEHLIKLQRFEGIAQFAGGLAHEFNNMMGIIIGFAELTNEELPEDSELAAALSAIQSTAERAAVLTRQLLAFANRQTACPSECNLNEIIDGGIQVVIARIGLKIGLHKQLTSEPGFVCIDSTQLQQVIINLVDNACDAMPAGGVLSITTGRYDQSRKPEGSDIPAGRYCVLTVKDTGIGMTPETKARLFEPFFTTKEPGTGTGLALASVYGIIRQNGGYIEVESTPDQGTEFRILLPQVLTNGDQVLHGTEPSRHLDLIGSILVVEDKPALLDLMASALRNSGFNVIVASDGVLAMRLMDEYQNEIGMLISDLVMPGIDGVELARRVIRSGRDIPVLITSGRSLYDLPEDLTSNGMVGWINKPFRPKDLVQKVRAILSRSNGNSVSAG